MTNKSDIVKEMAAFLEKSTADLGKPGRLRVNFVRAVMTIARRIAQAPAAVISDRREDRIMKIKSDVEVGPGGATAMDQAKSFAADKALGRSPY